MTSSSTGGISLGGVSGTAISGEGQNSSAGNNYVNLRDRQNQLVWELALQIIKLVTTTTGNSSATSCNNTQGRNETLIRLMISLLSETLAASSTLTLPAATKATAINNPMPGGYLQQTLMASLAQLMGPNAVQQQQQSRKTLQLQQQHAQPQQPLPQQPQGGDVQQNLLASLAQLLGPNAAQQRQQQGSSTSSSNNSVPLNGDAFPQQQMPQRHAIREVTIPNAAYPMTKIEFPGPHDVVLGRGRGASSHIGNINFRALIKHYKEKYSAANRIDKPKVAGEVVAQWRKKDPPGRFLMQVRTTDRNLWRDVGDRKARQKTSQSLRERECRRKKRRRSKQNEPRETPGSFSSTGSSCDSDDAEEDGEDDGFFIMATTGSRHQKKRPAAPVSAESSSGASATFSGSDSATASDNAAGSDNGSGSG